MKIAIIGAGWAGMAAAVEATTCGHRIALFEASRVLGGRARSVPGQLPDGSPVSLDNGQHILIGAYSQTLQLMRQVGVSEREALLRLPMTLRFPDASGVQFPRWSAPLDALAGIVGARGWRLADKWSLLRLAGRWQRQAFQCDATLSVAQLCRGLSPRVTRELIEPLCLSALNTATEHASAQVFLRILKDALLGETGSSHLLLPRVDLSELFPNAAARWLTLHGAELHLGQRIDTVTRQGGQWDIGQQRFDAVLVATSATESVRLLEHSAAGLPDAVARSIAEWAPVCRGLRFAAISTVYAWGAEASLTQPMLALHSTTSDISPAPAQFVFDRGQLGSAPGLLAFVVSASDQDRETLQAQVLQQAQMQLGLSLQAIQTIVERRATFVCTPALLRPAQRIAPGLLVCGDYVAGPYPATLEGAVRSGVSAARAVALDVYDVKGTNDSDKESTP
ncbi:MAG: hydroxysqualene dehydroxylase HpnE [Comamonadaceae bacterium]|jgi:hydroxysqualene dehydroxylase